MSKLLRSTRRRDHQKYGLCDARHHDFPGCGLFRQSRIDKPQGESQGQGKNEQGQGAQGEMVPAPWISRTLRAGAPRVRRAGVSMSDWWFPLLICGLAGGVVSAAALLMW